MLIPPKLANASQRGGKMTGVGRKTTAGARKREMRESRIPKISLAEMLQLGLPKIDVLKSENSFGRSGSGILGLVGFTIRILQKSRVRAEYRKLDTPRNIDRVLSISRFRHRASSLYVLPLFFQH